MSAGYSNLYIIFLISITGLWFATEICSFLSETCSASSINCNKQNRTEYYVAAVVEYKPIPIGNQTAAESLLSNVNGYIQLMEDACNHNVDIIVFPEYGITTIALPVQREQAREYFVQVPAIGSTPCDDRSLHNSNQTQVLYDLSCASKRFQMYVVVNLGEIDACDNEDIKCPTDGAYHYNTNVVFDRKGAIIARYRKFHLYFEPQFDYPPLEYSTFKTDFEVEFGLFTCFDILFAHPAVEMVASKSIRNFAFPTAWVDELPFLTAIQAQSMWAQSNKANLLASGYHHPERGSMGSGIYSGHHYGALKYVFDSNSGTQLIISRVPISPENQSHSVSQSSHPKSRKPETLSRYHSEFHETNHFWLREDLSNCSHKIIDLQVNRDSICHDSVFCCDIEYATEATPNTTGNMVLIAFSGRRTVAAKRDWFEWQVCAVVYCLNETLESCTENIPPSAKTTDHLQFEEFAITMHALKIEYKAGVAEPALSLIDTSFNLIPQNYFNIRQWRDNDNGLHFAQANTTNSTSLADVRVKTIALIQKVYNDRL